MAWSSHLPLPPLFSWLGKHDHRIDSCPSRYSSLPILLPPYRHSPSQGPLWLRRSASGAESREAKSISSQWNEADLHVHSKNPWTTQGRLVPRVAFASLIIQNETIA